MCKGIQDSHGFWIPRRGFRIPVTGFQIFSIGTRIPDSNCQWDSRFLQLFSGFQTPGFGIPLAKISWIPESGFPCMYKGIQDSLGFWIPDSRSFSVELGFRIPNVSGIPDSYSCIPVSKGQEPGFQKQKFPGFGNPYFLTLDEIPNKQCNAIHLSNPSDYIRSYVMVRVTLFRQNENQISAVISSRKSNLKGKISIGYQATLQQG